MNRAARAAVLACALAAVGPGDAAAGEPWERIWLRVPLNSDGAVPTGVLLEIAHDICQALGGRHYQSGSSQLGPTLHNPWTEHGLDRVVVAACTAEREKGSAAHTHGGLNE